MGELVFDFETWLEREFAGREGANFWQVLLLELKGTNDFCLGLVSLLAAAGGAGMGPNVTGAASMAGG